MDTVDHGNRRPNCEVERVLFVPTSLSGRAPPNIAGALKVERPFDYRLKSN